DTRDWRLQGQERYLEAATLVRRVYRPLPPQPDSNHDHCDFCWAKFAATSESDVLTEGFCTLDESRWICARCVADFAARVGWTLANEGRLSERRAVELHDSQLGAVVIAGDDAVLQLRPATVHSSLGTPGDDRGSVWVEPIDIVIRRAAELVDPVAACDV